jgi:hypothetical protein
MSQLTPYYVLRSWKWQIRGKHLADYEIALQPHGKQRHPVTADLLRSIVPSMHTSGTLVIV